MLTTPPLSLYVHFPWCVRKCPYCDFNSHAAHGPVPEQRYIEILLRDLALSVPRCAAREIRSVFLGGGTPSLFSPRSMQTLLEGIGRSLRLAADAEITMEANPGTIERGRFADYKSAGITRVSLGAQSFEPRHLAALGRIHSAEETYRAVDELAVAGITNFNLDLMYGLPGQSPAQARADLAAAIALNPAHLSHYQLTLEPGTAFFHAPPPLPADDETWQMQLECQELLAAHGFAQYEVSAYARPHRQSRHNLNYWEFGDYVGIGAGAHGKITLTQAATILRTERARSPKEYIATIERGEPPVESPVPGEQLPFEFMLNALRLRAGFACTTFEARTGLAVSAIEPPLRRARERGLVREIDGQGWRCTDLGYRFLNDLLEYFLPESPVRRQDSYTQAPTMESVAKRCD
jgi:oxygen-independent coproporphyrinogen-3 oxidase